MKGFIEVECIKVGKSFAATDTDKLLRCINVDDISFISSSGIIVLKHTDFRFMCKETYEEIKAMLEKAVE